LITDKTKEKPQSRTINNLNFELFLEKNCETQMKMLDLADLATYGKPIGK
jgi:hypothetical protein